jgi:hypothetical protein
LAPPRGARDSIRAKPCNPSLPRTAFDSRRLVSARNLRYRPQPMALPAGVAMNPEANLDDVEVLLSRDARARLPLWRQILLYLNPFALFKDAARGPAWMRERALAYNRAMRWVLLTYIRRYVLMAGVLFLGIAPAEALAAEASILIIPAAAAAVGCCIALSVAACAWAGYVLLGARAGRS